MPRDTKELYTTAAALPERERAILIMRLRETLCPPQTQQLHNEESVARLHALLAGELELIEHSEAMRLISG